MMELFSMGLFWFFLLAEIFTFFMQRTFSTWQGANQTTPAIMTVVSFICTIALIVLLIFILIRVRPWWYGLVMLFAGFIIPTILPIGKSGETVVAMIGIVGAPLFTVLSFLKVFSVI